MGIRCALEFSCKCDVKHRFILEEMLFLKENPALECAGTKEGPPQELRLLLGAQSPWCSLLSSARAWVLFHKIISSVVPWFVATDTSCSKELSSHSSTILLEIYLGRKLVLSAECEKAGVFWLHFFLSFPFHLKKPAMP